jgi:hypothetical protein
MKQALCFAIVALLAVPTDDVSAQERIELRADGNYDVYYTAHQNDDETQPLALRKDIYFVHKKIKPAVTNGFATNTSGHTVYSYTIGNGVGAAQKLGEITVDRLSSVVASRPLDGVPIGSETQQQADSADLRAGIAAVVIPQTWYGDVLPVMARPDLGLRFAAGSRENASLAPGASLTGLSFVSKDLPGITRSSQFRGEPDGLTSFYEPKPQGAVGDQLETIRGQDFVSPLMVIPRVQVDANFNAVATLASWSTELTRSVWPDVITATLATQVKADIDAAKNAAERNNKAGAIQNLQALIARVPNDAAKPKEDRVARQVLRYNANYVIAKLRL